MNDDDEDRPRRKYRADDDTAGSSPLVKRAALVMGLLVVLLAVGAFSYVAGVRSGRSELPPFGARLTPLGEWEKGRDMWFRVDTVVSSEGKTDVHFTVVNKGAGPLELEPKGEPFRVRIVTTSGAHLPPEDAGRTFHPARLQHEEQATGWRSAGGTVGTRDDLIAIFTGGPFGSYGRAFVVRRGQH